MKTVAMSKILAFAITVFKEEYGYCGVADAGLMVLLNSGGKGETLTLKLEESFDGKDDTLMEMMEMDRKELALQSIKRMMENGLKAQLGRGDRTQLQTYKTALRIVDRVVAECNWALEDE